MVIARGFTAFLKTTARFFDSRRLATCFGSYSTPEIVSIGGPRIQSPLLQLLLLLTEGGPMYQRVDDRVQSGVSVTEQQCVRQSQDQVSRSCLLSISQ